MPKVSIIIVNYNGSIFITKLLQSIFNQVFQDFEVIFVDNASTDDSIQKIEHFLFNNPSFKCKFKLVKNKLNTGFSKGNLRGLELAKGDYIMFLNNDAFLANNCLESLITLLDSDLKIGAVQPIILDAKNGNIQSAGFLMDKYCETYPNINPHSTNYFYLSGACMIVRRSIIEKIGAFDGNLFYGDYDLSWRIRLAGYKLGVSVNSICHHYGRYATSMLFTDTKEFTQYVYERLYVAAKNYELKNCMLRLPLILIFTFIRAFYNSINFRKNFFSSWFKALLLFTIHLRRCIEERVKVQMIRKVPDNVLEKSMLNHPRIIMDIKKLIMHI